MNEHSTGVGRRSARVLLVAVAGVLGALLLAAPGVAGAPAVGCENRTNNTYDKLLGCVTLEGVREHQAAFQAIADANGGNRAAGTPGYDASVDYVIETLEAAGWSVDTARSSTSRSRSRSGSSRRRPPRRTRRAA